MLENSDVVEYTSFQMIEFLGRVWYIIHIGWKNLYNECDYPKKFSHFNPMATDGQIAELESKFKFPILKEYKEFLRFFNGARIMDNDIYEIHEFGMSDHYVPAGYLAIGRNELPGRRIV